MVKHNIHLMSYDEVKLQISSAENMQLVIDVITNLTKDTTYGDHLLKLLHNRQPETRSFVAWLAKTLQPTNYLEVGTRRGWSLATVASCSPKCELYSFDEWHENYGGSENPGPDFVQSELTKLGCKNPITFVSGDSHVTLREFFKKNPTKMFDMILIDGDHSVDGAYQDLKDTISNVAVGGAIIFDDIVDCEGLLGVWQAIEREHPNFYYFTYLESKPGVAFAIRLR